MTSEAATQQHIRRALAQAGVQAWRNNTGAFKDESGRWVRYGLANDSAQLNDQIKSSDLICCIPTLITPDMLFKVFGRFGAVECKPSDWTFSEKDKRAVAQGRYHAIVCEAGGVAGFARSPAEALGIIKR